MNYQWHYDRLMARAPKVRTDGEYRERHRIMPGFRDGKYTIGNIAYLTPEEHFVAHQLLVKIFKGTVWYSKAIHAAHMMTITGNGQRRHNKDYGWLKRMNALASSLSMTGKPKSEKHRASMRKPKSEAHKANMRKPKSVEHRTKFLGNKNSLGCTRSEEFKSNLSAKMTGYKYSKVTCSHCGKIGGTNVMNRWHFDNCKLKGD